MHAPLLAVCARKVARSVSKPKAPQLLQHIMAKEKVLERLESKLFIELRSTISKRKIYDKNQIHNARK
jgi:hypothetical protein